MIVEVDFKELYNFVVGICEEAGQHGCSGTLTTIGSKESQKELEEKCK